MTQTSKDIPVSRVTPNPYQPREHFPEKAQRELQESIRSNGLIQPIVVRAIGEDYQILAGERRFRAVTDLGLPTITAIIQELSDEEMQTLSIIENIQREDLNPMDLARSYQSLVDELEYSREGIAKKLGKDRSTVANTLRLLELPKEIQKLVESQELSAGHARALHPLKDSPKARNLAKKIVENGWSVRETERKVKQTLSGAPARPAPGFTKVNQTKDPNVQALEEQMSTHLQTRVEIWGESEGSIQISFSDVRDFNRIFNLILEKESYDDEEDFD